MPGASATGGRSAASACALRSLTLSNFCKKCLPDGPPSFAREVVRAGCTGRFKQESSTPQARRSSRRNCDRLTDARRVREIIMLRYTVGTVVLLALVSVAAADSPLSDKGSTRTRPGLTLTQLPRATATTAASWDWDDDYDYRWHC